MLGSYDLAWVVMERLPHGPLNSHWNGAEFDLLIERPAGFTRLLMGRRFRNPRLRRTGKKSWTWPANISLANTTFGMNSDGKMHSNAARKDGPWLAAWNSRPRNYWVHGDLHLANAVTRQPAPAGPAVLIDFAEVHAGHWVEDAVYFEHLYWARRQRLGGRKLVSQLAHERKKLGLHVDADWPMLAATKRALLAMSTPAMLQADGDPTHVEAALQVLEIEVGHA
ncbi:MAG: phosphotransferase [Phycisphaerales bacterium]|nr:phosphotransferase [Phycisphaerales bacterium]